MLWCVQLTPVRGQASCYCERLLLLHHIAPYIRNTMNNTSDSSLFVLRHFRRIHLHSMITSSRDRADVTARISIFGFIFNVTISGWLLGTRMTVTGFRLLQDMRQVRRFSRHLKAQHRLPHATVDDSCSRDI